MVLQEATAPSVICREVMVAREAMVQEAVHTTMNIAPLPAAEARSKVAMVRVDTDRKADTALLHKVAMVHRKVDMVARVAVARAAAAMAKAVTVKVATNKADVAATRAVMVLWTAAHLTTAIPRALLSEVVHLSRMKMKAATKADAVTVTET